MRSETTVRRRKRFWIGLTLFAAGARRRGEHSPDCDGNASAQQQVLAVESGLASSWADLSSVGQLRPGGFRQVELNAAGWNAVLGPGALVGLAGGIAFDRSLLLAVPAGAICSWFVAVSVDRWRWSRSECGYELSDLSREAADDLTAQLEKCGIRRMTRFAIAW